MNEVTATGLKASQEGRPRWDAAGHTRLAEHALLVRDPGPMVIRNEKGCRALRRRGDGLCPFLARNLSL